MNRTVVLNLVALTRPILARMPRASSFAAARNVATIGHVTPAVTCSAQATYLTGTHPAEHGIVGNGWYFRDECEIRFWHQSARLVQRPRLWDLAKARDARFTCANLFWWHAMYSSADVTVTPRPMYPADGRKIPDLWTNPPELRYELQRRLGRFPLFKFWGPMTSIDATRWIASAAIEVDRRFDPTLSLVYLPHLDYALQRLGPNDPSVETDVRELDAVVGDLLDHFEKRGARIILLSEYGIQPVSKPIHLNRRLRAAGLLRVREELGRELLDAGASDAFAVADHQVAHVYVNDVRKIEHVAEVVRSTPGVGAVLVGAERGGGFGIDHPRAGEIVALARPEAWFTYYYWLDDGRAPDFAQTVDIHRKPGYDPAELFIDPQIGAAKFKIAWTLLKRKIGMRTLLKVVPLDANLVKGSHGVEPADDSYRPVFVSWSAPRTGPTSTISPLFVQNKILEALFE